MGKSVATAYPPAITAEQDAHESRFPAANAAFRSRNGPLKPAARKAAPSSPVGSRPRGRACVRGPRPGHQHFPRKLSEIEHASLKYVFVEGEFQNPRRQLRSWRLESGALDRPPPDAEAVRAPEDRATTVTLVVNQPTVVVCNMAQPTMTVCSSKKRNTAAVVTVVPRAPCPLPGVNTGRR